MTTKKEVKVYWTSWGKVRTAKMDKWPEPFVPKSDYDQLAAELERVKAENKHLRTKVLNPLVVTEMDDLTTVKAKLDKAVKQFGDLAKSCEWYADKGTQQERHHFLKVEALHIYEQTLKGIEETK